MQRDTSLKAYINEVAPTLGARQIAVLEVYEHADGKDFTNEELAAALEWGVNRITPRVLELRNLGILEESRKRKCGITGREVHAWRIKDRPAVSPRAISPVPARYQMPSISHPGETHKIKVREDSPTCDCKGFLFRKHCSHIDALKRRKPRPEETMTPLFT